ncbi:hypothetical protein D3C71_1346100 [compost metagenome]
MVRATENPSFLLASCCNVDVVNGADGERFAGFVSRFFTENSAALQSSKNLVASASVAKRCGSSALKLSLTFPV